MLNSYFPDIQKIAAQLRYNPMDPLLFNSGFFLFFLFFFVLIYQFLYKKKVARVLFFTIASLYFFYKASGFYFLLILFSAFVDFNLSNWIYRATDQYHKKALLIFSITINLALLCYFKYTNFFIDIINSVKSGSIDPIQIALPIGISFYTFENLSYTIDVYNNKFKPVNSLLDYCFFLSFFPKLVMGPIVRASDFIPQIKRDVLITENDISKGLYLILGGLFKKMIISDYIYLNFVKHVFNVPELHSGVECLFAVYGYAMVIYCDFSGYSDIAIGLAKWMGFEININFKSPYQSSSITEFWRRWHISLSSWLRDYLYIPLGGNKKGKTRQYINLFITMLLGGLWHGASWNFVAWGGLHGLALAFEKLMSEKLKIKKTLFLKFMGTLLTFHFVCFCWIFFKAETFGDSIFMLKQISGNFNPGTFIPMLKGYQYVFLLMLLGYALHFLPDGPLENKGETLFNRIGFAGRALTFIIFIWLAIQVKSTEHVLPIYLQF
jgi:alginate O-acetyltransferase complex protein AlgI